jgi:hypothetical protein
VPTKWIIAGGLATGLGVLWEPPSRQEELAIYVVPQVRSYSQTHTHTHSHTRAHTRTHTHTHTHSHTLTHSHCLQALTIVWNIARRRGLVPAVPAWEVIMFSLAMGVTMHHFERYQHSHCLVLCCVVLRQQVHSRSLTSTIAWFQGRDNSMCLLEQWLKVDSCDANILCDLRFYTARHIGMARWPCVCQLARFVLRISDLFIAITSVLPVSRSLSLFFAQVKDRPQAIRSHPSLACHRGVACKIQHEKATSARR